MYQPSYYSEFKRSHTLNSRVQESYRILSKYPDRIPIICEKSQQCNDLPIIDKKKFLVPYDFTMAQFIYVIRQRLKLRPDEAIFLSFGDKIVSGSATFNDIYNHYKDYDGFLYVQYNKENTFG